MAERHPLPFFKDRILVRPGPGSEDVPVRAEAPVDSTKSKKKVKDTTFTCVICNKTLKGHYARHMLTHETECHWPSCQHVVSQATDLQKHLHEHNDNGVAPEFDQQGKQVWTCHWPLCTKGFKDTRKDVVSLHLKLHNSGQI